MTEAQAEAVVRMQLGQLAALERDEILKEYNDLREQIRGYEELLADEAQHPRRHPRGPGASCATSTATTAQTEITDDGGDVDMEDLIAEETNVVTISHNGYIKRLPLSTYRTPAPRRQGRHRRRRRARTTSSSTSSSPARTPTCCASPTAGRSTG